jgi:methyl acetate hydrolase
MSKLRDPRALDRVLTEAVGAAVVPGIAALVATGEDVLYEAAFGTSDICAGQEVTAETIFAIASMTKAVTAAAVLQLTERGSLTLDQPVAEILPAFGELQVLTSTDGVLRFRPPTRSAAVRDLLANTCGLAYDNWHADLWQYHAVTGLPKITAGSRQTFAAPLVADPGNTFLYGTGTDWAGLVVERLSGLALQDYFRRYITGPLGMVDTDAILTPAQRARVAQTHIRDRDGQWIVQFDEDAASAPDFYPGGHCLYSTPRDYLRFQRALLAGGTLNGVRILGEGSVRTMMTNQVGMLDLPPARTTHPQLCADLEFPPTAKWGLGLMITGASEPGMRPAGSAGWYGVRNTHQWLDPVNGIAVGLYAQTLPFREPGIMTLYAEFERRVYAELVPTHLGHRAGTSA